MIKAVFFDIDGTLIPFGDKDFPKSTKLALKALQKNGIKVFVATGRPIHIAAFIMELYPFDGYLTFNGQYCIDNNHNEIFEMALNKESIPEMIDYINENKIGAVFALKDKSYRNEYPTDPFFKDTEVIDPNKLKNATLMQVNAYIPEEKDEEFVSHFKGSKAARWNPTFADIIPIEGGKNNGIDHMIKHYGIKLEETMAFGDGGNDISMLEHCHIGVAMGNANDKVKARADYVTTNVDDDGIYNALRHFNII